MWGQILAWLGSAACLEFLKKIGKLAWGYAWSWFKAIWDNAWLLAWTSACTTLFVIIMNMLNGWFGFPPLLNLAVHGIYHLGNMAWVIRNWKRAPVNPGSGSTGPKVSLS